MRVPAEILKASIDENELVLPYAEALQLVALAESSNAWILGWEGWLLYPDGRRGHSAEHQGTFSLHNLNAAEAPGIVRKTIEQAQAEWLRSPEAVGAQLLFCITVET